MRVALQSMRVASGVKAATRGAVPCRAGSGVKEHWLQLCVAFAY